MIYKETYFEWNFFREQIKTIIMYITSQMILVQTRRKATILMPTKIIRMIIYSLQKIFSTRT